MELFGRWSTLGFPSNLCVHIDYFEWWIRLHPFLWACLIRSLSSGDISQDGPKHASGCTARCLVSMLALILLIYVLYTVHLHLLGLLQSHRFDPLSQSIRVWRVWSRSCLWITSVVVTESWSFSWLISCRQRLFELNVLTVVFLFQLDTHSVNTNLSEPIHLH